MTWEVGPQAATGRAGLPKGVRRWRGVVPVGVAVEVIAAPDTPRLPGAAAGRRLKARADSGGT
jgi:hypothetical protein